MTQMLSEEKIFVQTQILRPQLDVEGFRLVSGAFLPELEIAYETYGTLNAYQSNAIFICSHLTSDAHAAGWHSEDDKQPGWWDEMIGPGKSIDTLRHFVIASNMLGGCKGTTGPASIDPRSGKPYGSNFPVIEIADIVNVQRLLTKNLGIDVLEAVIGGSLGGMQALQWTVSYPDKVKKCMGIATAASLSAQALGFEVIGRKVILEDSSFRMGDYYSDGKGPDRGLRLARMIGHLTYLSSASMDTKFGRQHREGIKPGKFETDFSIESYLDHKADAFVGRFDANSYLHITYAMDCFDLARSYGSLEDAFKKTQAEFLLVALSSDWLFPPEQTRDITRVLLKQGKVASEITLNSPYGHDAFLLEVENLGRVIESFLNPVDHTPFPGIRKDSVTESSRRSREKQETIFNSTEDFVRLRDLIEPQSHVLDVGCGDGSLIDFLWKTKRVTGVGIDIDLDSVVACLAKNVPVFQTNVDEGLADVGTGLFDYAILNRTLQEVRHPVMLLRELLRVAKKGIVTFPNFAHLRNRVSLAIQGVMPISESLPYSWHNTPNIHLFSYADFEALCKSEGIHIECALSIGRSVLSRLLVKTGFLNLGAEYAIVRISYQNKPSASINPT